MILVDSSVWIDHLHISDSALLSMLEREQVLMHPFVLGEIALGHVRRREHVLRELGRLQQCDIARDDEVMSTIADRKWFGKGIGYPDAHLLVSVLITPDAKLWTLDKHLAALAQSVHVAFYPRVN